MLCGPVSLHICPPSPCSHNTIFPRPTSLHPHVPLSHCHIPTSKASVLPRPHNVPTSPHLQFPHPMSPIPTLMYTTSQVSLALKLQSLHPVPCYPHIPHPRIPHPLVLMPHIPHPLHPQLTVAASEAKSCPAKRATSPSLRMGHSGCRSGWKRQRCSSPALTWGGRLALGGAHGCEPPAVRTHPVSPQCHSLLEAKQREADAVLDEEGEVFSLQHHGAVGRGVVLLNGAGGTVFVPLPAAAHSHIDCVHLGWAPAPDLTGVQGHVVGDAASRQHSCGHKMGGLKPRGFWDLLPSPPPKLTTARGAALPLTVTVGRTPVCGFTLRRGGCVGWGTPVPPMPPRVPIPPGRRPAPDSLSGSAW